MAGVAQFASQNSQSTDLGREERRGLGHSIQALLELARADGSGNDGELILGNRERESVVSRLRHRLESAGAIEVQQSVLARFATAPADVRSIRIQKPESQQTRGRTSSLVQRAIEPGPGQYGSVGPYLLELGPETSSIELVKDERPPTRRRLEFVDAV